MTEAAQNGKCPAFAVIPPSVQAAATRNMSAVNRNRGRKGKGKNKKVHKQDWHLYARAGKRCLVSTSLHHHTNTKPRENNAVYLGFHKLRSGRSQTTATSFCASSNDCKPKRTEYFLCSALSTVACRKKVKKCYVNAIRNERAGKKKNQPHPKQNKQTPT